MHSEMRKQIRDIHQGHFQLPSLETAAFPMLSQGSSSVVFLSPCKATSSIRQGHHSYDLLKS